MNGGFDRKDLREHRDRIQDEVTVQEKDIRLGVGRRGEQIGRELVGRLRDELIVEIVFDVGENSALRKPTPGDRVCRLELHRRVAFELIDPKRLHIREHERYDDNEGGHENKFAFRA